MMRVELEGEPASGDIRKTLVRPTSPVSMLRAEWKKGLECFVQVLKFEVVLKVGGKCFLKNFGYEGKI